MEWNIIDWSRKRRGEADWITNMSGAAIKTKESDTWTDANNHLTFSAHKGVTIVTQRCQRKLKMKEDALLSLTTKTLATGSALRLRTSCE